MSKFVIVGLMVGSLLAGATTVAQAQQGGVGDPLTLAASGVLIPYFTDLSTVATLQVSSPVSDNPNLHLFFFDNHCNRIGPSVGMPLTTNDIAFQQVSSAQNGPVPVGTNGLITIAQATQSGFALQPLVNPIHARVYLFSAVDGRSRILEPIILNTAEFPTPVHWWSPLRSGGAFFAPLQTAAVNTDLFLICPKDAIEGGAAAANGGFGVDPGGNGDFQFTVIQADGSGGFPQINPRFPVASTTTIANAIRVRIYDTNEVFKRDFLIDCDCVIRYAAIAQTVSPFYADPVEAAFGTYTEITTAPPSGGRRVTFTGYTSTFTVGSAINAFFARFHNGSQPSIDGTVTNTR